MAHQGCCTHSYKSFCQALNVFSLPQIPQPFPGSPSVIQQTAIWSLGWKYWSSGESKSTSSHCQRTKKSGMVWSQDQGYILCCNHFFPTRPYVWSIWIWNPKLLTLNNKLAPNLDPKNCCTMYISGLSYPFTVAWYPWYEINVHGKVNPLLLPQ